MINKIPNCKNRRIESSFSGIEEVVEYVKQPPKEHQTLIESARGMDRKSPEYSAIKTSLLPAVCINFNFDKNYINGKNLSEPTGYLFLEVDGMIETDFEINTTYVCAYWRSLSNTGVHLVVKVLGLTRDNFMIATQEIGNLLDIPYDKSAVSIDRLTVLPYDPKAYYNENVEIIDVNELLRYSNDLVEDDTKKTQCNNIIELNTKGYDCGVSFLRFDNLNEIIDNLKIEYDSNGLYDFGKNSKLKYSKVFIPPRMITEGEREQKISSICGQLIALNKTAPKEQLLALLYYLNQKKVFPMLDRKELNQIFEKKYRNRLALIPMKNAVRRFIYDPSKTMTTKQKRALNNKKRGEVDSKETLNKIIIVMQNWNTEENGKITNKKIGETLNLHENTIQRYTKYLKRKRSRKVMRKFIVKNNIYAESLSTVGKGVPYKKKFLVIPRYTFFQTHR